MSGHAVIKPAGTSPGAPSRQSWIESLHGSQHSFFLVNLVEAAEKHANCGADC